MGRLRSLLTTFQFNGQTYHYFCHHYNATWCNERTVEVPIAWKFVRENAGKEILELGNVLSHYFKIAHMVVDKYEKAAGVINKDIMSLSTVKKYDAIVSVSTLEHIGYDETPKDPNKIVKSVKKLHQLLKPGGKLFITFSVGYNPHLDKFLQQHKIAFDHIFYLKRTSRENQWKEVAARIALKSPKYNFPFANSNVIGIGISERSGIY